jgi:hypothetical protein
MADVVTIECPRCRRPVAEITSPDGRTQAAGGSVREEPGPDGEMRYRVACAARRHGPQVRTWTAATLGLAFRAYRRSKPRISMADVRRDVSLPRFEGTADGGARSYTDPTAISFGGRR